MARHFLIDTDTGSDDAVALVMAMQYPDVQIEAVTVVAGNVPVDHLHVTGREPNAEVVTEASREQFLRMLLDAVGRM